MLPVAADITFTQILEWLLYNPITGELCWKIKRGRVAAGTPITGDYIKLNGKSYVTARVIWCLHYKEWPPLDKIVEHKSRRHGDNWITNLRLASYQQNSFNRAGHSTYPKGVSRRDRMSRPWVAKIMIDGITIELGSFHTQEEAAEAYRQAALKHHGEFACLK